MKRRLALSLALLTILMVVSATSLPTQGATYKLGVQAGNTADYTASLTTGASMTKLHASIHNATGTVAGIDFTYHFTNGSVALTGSALVDVATTNASSGSSIYLIAANLTTNDPVISGFLPLNQTTTLIAAGVNRTVNHLLITLPSMGIYFNNYWDQLTGILVQANMNVSTSIGWVNLTMSGTNMWGAGATGGTGGLSSSTLLIVGAVVVVVIVIVVAVLLLRRRK
jgi:hypothetical protein